MPAIPPEVVQAILAKLQQQRQLQAQGRVPPGYFQGPGIPVPGTGAANLSPALSGIQANQAAGRTFGGLPGGVTPTGPGGMPTTTPNPQDPRIQYVLSQLSQQPGMYRGGK